MSHIQYHDEHSFDAFADANKRILLRFWAPWCGPCRVLKPVIDSIAAQLKGWVVTAESNIEINADLAKRFSINSFPTIFLIVNGASKAQIVGVLGEEELIEKSMVHLKIKMHQYQYNCS